MNVKKLAFVVPTLCMLLYLCVAFVMAELNPFNWEAPVRFVLAVFWGGAVFIPASIVYLDGPHDR